MTVRKVYEATKGLILAWLMNYTLYVVIHETIKLYI